MKPILTTFLACQLSLSAATIWKLDDPGITEFTFTKDPFTDPTDQANWDIISPSVAITRLGVNAASPIFNPLVEDFWNAPSPFGTRWAFAGINGNPSILSADDYASYSFTTFREAYGFTAPARVLGQTGVLHLIAEDIYLDIMFLGWGNGRSGGGGSFSYVRAEGIIPEPSTLAFLISSGTLLLLKRKRR